ncbi:MAG: zinc transporter ZupT [Dehalococcoidales bacterium]|nr:zinc transporter ZupT [Dehalococcoidales bacterium]
MSSNVSFAFLLTLLAGLSTGIGSAFAYFLRKPRPRHMALLLGFSAGVMLYISFGELLHLSLENVGFITANLVFFAGIIAIALLDMLVPHEYQQEHVGDSLISPDSVKAELAPARHGRHRFGERRTGRGLRLRRAGVFVALGIAIHNFPEGIAVFSSAITSDVGFGVLVAIAIALHNIPEGICVSVPISEATGNRRRAFLYSFAAGLAEPVGALIAYAVLFPFLTPNLVYALLAFAAGVMVYISLDELLPTAHLYGEEHIVILGVISGMIVMAFSVYLLS